MRPVTYVTPACSDPDVQCGLPEVIVTNTPLYDQFTNYSGTGLLPIVPTVGKAPPAPAPAKPGRPSPAPAAPGRPTRAPPVQVISAPPASPPPLLANDALDTLAPIGAAVAPWAFALPEVAPLATGGEILGELLGTELQMAEPGAAELASLLQKDLGGGLLEQLLNRPLSNISIPQTFAEITPATETAAGQLSLFDTALGLASRALGALSLLTYSEPAGQTLSQEQQAVEAQLQYGGSYGAPPPPQPPGDTGGFVVPDTIPTPDIISPGLTVEAQRPAPDTTPSRVPSPLLASLLLPLTALLPGFRTLPGAKPVAQPSPATSPAIATATEPLRTVETAPGPGQRPGRGPSQQVSPGLAQLPSPLTQTSPLQATAPETQQQKCEKQKDQKQKKKRKQRQVCHRGTYTETRKSTLKHPKETIECQ